MTLKNITAKVGYIKSWAILNLPAHLCGLAFRAAQLEPKRNNGWFYPSLSVPLPWSTTFIVGSGENMSLAAGDEPL